MLFVCFAHVGQIHVLGDVGQKERNLERASICLQSKNAQLMVGLGFDHGTPK